MPTSHTKRPSLTGPNEPIVEPPYFGEFSMLSRKAMMSRFSSGFSTLSEKTGICWGPVSIAS